MTLLAIILGVHLAYWIFIFTGIIAHREKHCESDHTCDLVVCVKNEEDKINGFLDRISGSNFRSVIVVDDFSADKSYEILEERKDIVLMRPDINRKGKKAAVVKGIQTSKSDYIAFTDIDCEPSDSWSRLMLSEACENDLVLGYSPMKKVKGCIPFFSRYETYHTALQYLSYAIKGMAYMGVGRNLLVKRVKGIEAIPTLMESQIASGDDDLLVNHIAQRDNVGIILHSDSFVPTEPKMNWADFIRQKSRHVSTASSYKWWHQVMLAVYSGTFILFYLGVFLFPLFGWLSWTQALLLLVIKWGVQQVINYPIMKKLKEIDLWLYFPLLDIAMFIYVVVLSPYLFIKNTSRWN